ncbi:hypothetical protein Ait01nite_006760 [Actinoplanes italicus]|uniref:Uncharacterized protein n=1 Tax=Actinoplanes italicus TaxID=113567 RepID=A0A2T0KLY6_9ACTN|nr:hypothetical protein CLV67_102418 [Actinoplanes italicus]GIE27631.1 hypothetical protein Ait01nite_006760 [Actinoplanes italicus]
MSPLDNEISKRTEFEDHIKRTVYEIEHDRIAHGIVKQEK